MHARYFFWALVLLFGCRTSPTSYRITVDGVFSKHNAIQQFSISQFKMDHHNLDDIRPKEHIEVMRYCCELKGNRNGEKAVLFKDSPSYLWSLCKLDTSIIANDSLTGLSFDEKLIFLNKRDTHNDEVLNSHLQLPFSIKKGYVYQIFGLPNLNGSYYFYLNPDDKLLVQFVDKGPW